MALDQRDDLLVGRVDDVLRLFVLAKSSRLLESERYLVVEVDLVVVQVLLIVLRLRLPFRWLLLHAAVVAFSHWLLSLVNDLAGAALLVGCNFEAGLEQVFHWCPVVSIAT